MQKNYQIRALVICALLAAISGVLAGPLAFYFFTWKISFAIVPIVIASILFGPVMGGLTGCVSDLISVFLILRNPYNPVFTITAILTGILPWLIFKLLRGDKKNVTFWKLLVAVGVTVLFCSFFLNTVWMIVIFGQTPALFITRLGVNLVMIPLNTAIIYLLLRTVFSKANLTN